MWRVVALFILSAPLSVSAQVVISEIMYDLAEGTDSGREWIEVYNVSDSTIDLTTWKVVESGKNHVIKSVFGGAVLPPGGFAIIADNAMKFTTDHPTFSGYLFDSAFGLNNKGEIIVLSDGLGVESDSVMYTSSLGGNSTGDSLQKINLAEAALTPGIPTPGENVPLDGLVQTTTKHMARAGAAATAAAPAIYSAPADSIRISETTTRTLPTQAPPSGLFALGVAILAALSAGGLVYARHLSKNEWTIIDES